MTLLQDAATVSGAQNSAAGARWVVLDELDREGRVVRLDQTIAAALADTGLVEVRPEAGGPGGWCRAARSGRSPSRACKFR